VQASVKCGLTSCARREPANYRFMDLAEPDANTTDPDSPGDDGSPVGEVGMFVEQPPVPPVNVFDEDLAGPG
jgi:hypothetical protein